jgi:hypothetical protein
MNDEARMVDLQASVRRLRVSLETIAKDRRLGPPRATSGGEIVLVELRRILQEKIGLPSDTPLPILSPRALWEELRSNPSFRSSPGT